MSGTISTGIPRNEIADVLLNGKFQNIVTVAKTGRANFICSKYPSDSVCIQAALDYIAGIGGGTLIVMRGHYACTSSLSYLADNLTFQGQGNDTILDFSSIPNYRYIKVNGSISTVNSLLTAPAAKGDLTITVANGALFAAGDWIRIRSEAIFQPRPSETDPWSQRVGEIQQIASINGNVLTLRELIFGDYTLADTATVDKVNMLKNITFKDFSIVSTPAMNDGFGITIMQAVNVSVENVNCENIHDHVIYFCDVVDGKCTDSTARDANKAELGYGLAVANASRDIYAAGNHYFNCRHGVTCGGDHTYGIQYNQTYVGNTHSYDVNNIGMFGMHPTYDGLVIANNVCESGGLGYINGKNSIVIGNTVMNVKGNEGGIKISRACENGLIIGNLISTINSPGIFSTSLFPNNTIQDNVIFCSAPGIQGILTELEVSNMVIKGNTITSAGTPILIRNNVALVDSTNIDISGNTLTCTGLDEVIEIRAYAKNIAGIKIHDNKINTASGGTGIKVWQYTGNTGTLSNMSLNNNVVSGGNYGILIANTTNFSIRSNMISDSSKGIYIGPSSGEHVIDGNTIINCTTPIDDTGAPQTIKNNYGYVTENSGTATITAGQTSVSVSHGLAAAPTRVQLTPTTATGGKQYYVSAKAASTFTISIDSAYTSDISFDWQAIV